MTGILPGSANSKEKALVLLIFLVSLLTSNYLKSFARDLLSLFRRFGFLMPSSWKV